MARRPWPPPHAAPPRDEREGLAERRARAFEEPLDIHRHPGSVYPMFDVRNPLHETHYRVMLPEYPDRASALCTCTDFARRGLGSCKHVEATLRWVHFHPNDARPGPAGPELSGSVWPEIDRRLAEEGSDPAPISLRLRRPGAVLFEIRPPGAVATRK